MDIKKIEIINDDDGVAVSVTCNLECVLDCYINDELDPDSFDVMDEESQLGDLEDQVIDYIKEQRKKK